MEKPKWKPILHNHFLLRTFLNQTTINIEQLSSSNIVAGSFVLITYNFIIGNESSNCKITYSSGRSY